METPRDTVFTTEYAVRTGMEAVYTLLDIGRGVPEVFASAYDARVLLKATASLLDGKKLYEIDLPVDTSKLGAILEAGQNTVIFELLKEVELI